MKKFISIIVIILAVVLSALLLSNRYKYTLIDPNKFEITTSFYPYYFFAQAVAKDKANVTNLTPPGAEPHDYEPTPADIIQIEKSKLLVINGVVEPWAAKIKSDLKGKNTTIVETGKNLFTQNYTDEDGIIALDPHIWLSPTLAKEQITVILNALIKIDPANTNYYTQNADDLLTKLDTLDNLYKNGLANCQKDFVTSHAAFGYLAKDYGLNQIAIAGVSPDAEPSLKELAQIAALVRQKNIKIIFFESLVSPKLSQTIADETGAKTLVLNPLEGLTQNELNQGQNYLTVMGENLKNLQIALSCH